ncbi:Cof-type HAD-IIB family hydrolase [uncultured Dokdonia sp.]|uniref:Cof-type HAD-IIB family hydrolase n=1 Tax=uncultured Dokdonia sp. TaxID=575653 RepID=UPI00262F8CA2|nr:Cof-type HAD-IIB family hydrolase [uncultured Dokdonia sp.]
MYHLICTDIDGTLLNTDRYLSNATLNAFANLPTDKVGANFPIILASSRMPSAMHYLQEGLGIKNASLIAYNGGLILGKNGVCIESNTMPLDLLEALLPHHTKHSYNLSIYADDDWYTDQEDFWSLREINNTRVTPTYQSALKSLETLNTTQRTPHKLMCMGDAKEIDSIVTHLSGLFADVVHLYRSKDTYLEITPKHIDKAKALRILLNQEFHFGMDRVIAFGDNHNDEELIKHAGLGVAVANATDQLKALANYVSPFTNKEDAVAKAIEKFVIGK